MYLAAHDIPVEVLQEGSPSGASNTHSQEPTRDRQLVNGKPGKNILPPITESLPDLHQMSTEATHEVYKAANTPRCEYIRGPSMWEQATGSQPTPPALMTLATKVNRRAPAPFRGGDSVPMFSSKRMGRPSTSSNNIVVQGGKKFMRLSSVPEKNLNKSKKSSKK